MLYYYKSHIKNSMSLQSVIIDRINYDNVVTFLTKILKNRYKLFIKHWKGVSLDLVQKINKMISHYSKCGQINK